MADHANTMPFNAIAMSASAKNIEKTIARLADTLMDLMEDVHGGSWLAQIDHETGFLLIRPRSVKPITKPRSGEIA